MPKIVDHDKRRKEIALKATAIFLEHGYKSIGMRQLCEQLGMSKSAVYHYFKSKDELFRAATEAIVSVDAAMLAQRPNTSDATSEQRLENFILIFQQMAPRYFQEMQLVADYIEVIGQENTATDPCMLLANQKYIDLLSKYVSTEHSMELYTVMLGLLNHQIMTGKSLTDKYISSMIKSYVD